MEADKSAIDAVNSRGTQKPTNENFSAPSSIMQVTGQHPPGCGGHVLAFVNDEILLIGGTDRSVTPCTDVFLLSKGRCGSWSAIATGTTVSFKPFKLIRTGASAVVMSDHVYIFGGQEPSTGLCCNDVLKFNATTKHWTIMDPKSGKPPPRHAHTCSKIGQHSFVIFGGASQDHKALNDVWVFNTTTLEWKHVVPGGAVVAGREMAAGTAVSENQFVVTGGRGRDGVLLDDVVLLDLSAEPLWTQILRHDSIRRCAHSAVFMHLNEAKGTRPQKPVVAIFGGFVGSGLSQELVCCTDEQMDMLRQWSIHTFVLQAKTMEHVLQVLLDTDAKTCTTLTSEDQEWPSARFAHAACPIPSACGHDTMCVYGGLGVETDSSDWYMWDPST